MYVLKMAFWMETATQMYINERVEEVYLNCMFANKTSAFLKFHLNDICSPEARFEFLSKNLSTLKFPRAANGAEFLGFIRFRIVSAKSIRCVDDTHTS